MTDLVSIPAKAVRVRLLANLRRTRLEMEAFGLELEEINSRLEQNLQQQRRERLRKSLSN